MTDKKKPDPFTHLDPIPLTNTMIKITKRVTVASATLGVRAIAGATRSVLRWRYQRRYLR